MEFRKCDRRQFLKMGILSLTLLPLVGRLIGHAQAADAKPGEALKLVPDSDPTAKALLYTPDASKAPADKRVDKMGVAAKDQLCSNCNFYAKKGDIKGAEVGQCQLILNGMVKSKGWCISWFKKA